MSEIFVGSMSRLDRIRTLHYMKETLLRYGWRKGDFGNTDLGFCLLGAIYHAGKSFSVTPDDIIYELSQTLAPNGNRQITPRGFTERYHLVAGFNYHAETLDQVISVIDITLDRLNR